MSRRSRSFAAVALVMTLSLAAPAAVLAGEAEAKNAARNANCAPGRVETLRNTPGPTGSIVYKVACTGPNLRDAFVRVECRERACTVLN
jgi:hypothetical protein